MSANAGDEHDPIELQDRAINQLFGTGLALADVLPHVTAEVADQLREVVQRLDAAVHDLRRAALAHAIDRRETRSAEPAGSLPTNWDRRLCSLSIDEVFAYAVTGHDFYRARDHMLWAHESDGLLLSARSGQPLARREGNIYYDTETDLPLYYEDRQTGRGPERSHQAPDT